MGAVLVVPEKNEGSSPLNVIEEGLRSPSIDAVFVVDGWSNDGTMALLREKLPPLAETAGKEVRLHRSKLRNTGKGGAMVTGMDLALDEGYSRVAFVDADISSATSGWFDYLVEGIDRYDADMTRGYFDRSPFDAQITRHVTLPAIHAFFPEGRGIRQPLGGELCMNESLVRHLLDHPLAPTHTWGIDTFLVVNTVVGGFRAVELYLAQKRHKPKTLVDLEGMLTQCFDEMAQLVHYHGRDTRVPGGVPSMVTTIPATESPVKRAGQDVRTAAYTDLEMELASHLNFVHDRQVDLGLAEELGVTQEDRALLAQMLEGPAAFREESRHLDGPRWVRILNSLIEGYIQGGFSARYHEVLYALWRSRAVAFFLHEAATFEEAEANTRLQAEYAYEFFRASEAPEDTA